MESMIRFIKNKILIIIVLLINVLSVGQNNKTMLIDLRLEDLVTEYVEESKSRGLDITPIMFKNIDSIILDSTLNYPSLGHYDSKTKSIRIARYTLIDRLIVKLVLFHELTHGVLIGYGHVCYRCSSIMAAKSPDSFAKYAIKEVWVESLDELFETIKLTLEKDGKNETQNNIQR